MSGEVIFVWPIDSHFGWGIRGLNYALSWPGVAVSSMPEGKIELPPGDERVPLLKGRLVQSQRFQGYLSTCNENGIIDAPVLVGMGNDLLAQRSASWRVFKGKPTIACPVFEDVAKVEKNIANLREYDAVVVASRWNQEVLVGLGIDAKLCHEGIDPTIFHPGVRSARGKREDGRFRVFSGGKVEYRKGQDIVIEAFKRFAETHDDAVLVAAWGSPFGRSGQDFDGKWEFGSPPGGHIGRPNFHAWVERAGLKPHQFEYVEPRANWRMAEIYAGCDVAVFPNRCEGGTNFVAMECMACGVPTILSSCFGHDDLMRRQFSIGEFPPTAALLAEALEHFRNGADMPPLSKYWTWDRHCRQMAEVIAGA